MCFQVRTHLRGIRIRWDLVRTVTIKVEALSEVCPESASILLVSVCTRHLETQPIQLQPGV